MVPSEFTEEEIQIAKLHIISKIKKNCRVVNNKVLGSAFLHYIGIANLLGYSFECESDGDRIGILMKLIANESFEEKKVLLPALVISKEFKRPGKGFYDLAEEKGLYDTNGHIDADGHNELTFWINHCNEVIKAYL